DEHLVPGRGAQPCAPLLGKLAADEYSGVVVLEVNTRRALSREARLADLTEALEFTRTYLGSPAPAGGQPSQGGGGRVHAGGSAAEPGAGGEGPARSAAGTDAVGPRGSASPANL